MKRAIVGLMLMFGLSAGPSWAGDALSFDDFWVAPSAGTLGVGVEAGYRWNENWGARADIYGASMPFTYHESNYDLHNRLTLLNAGVTADYYPFEGNFRVSGGVRVAANKIEGSVKNLKKHSNGSTTIIEDPLTDFTVRQNAIQPYLGTGYSVKLQDRVSLNFDLGALYAGTPSLSVDSRAHLFGFTRREINNEIEKARDRIAPFKFYPVVQIGLKVQF
jgi:hypothetical protein